jgi:hypothetical protein
MSMNIREIQSVIKNAGGGRQGATYFVEQILQPCLEGKKMSNGYTQKVEPDQISFTALFEAMVTPISGIYGQPLMSARMEWEGYNMTVAEALQSTQFPTAVSNIIQQALIESYNNVPTIGDQLVTTIRAPRKSERLSGYTSAQAPREVMEGMPYEQADFGDKYVVTDTKKKGLTISLTEETILFDQTGAIVENARNIGREARMERERTILNGVTDVDSNVYRPSGVATALYDNGGAHNNEIVNVLTDWTDIDVAKTAHKNQITDDRKGEPGQPIAWNPTQILVPTELEFEARNIVNATEIRTATASAAELRVSANHITGMQVISSPLVPGTDVWYIGEFARQFVWHEIWPIQVFQMGANSGMHFTNDVLEQYKVRYYGGIAARDFRWVIRNTAS